MIRPLLLVAIALMAPSLAQAQPAPAPVAAPVDPARLAAARGVIDILMPPATRQAMIEGMLRPMMANMRQTMLAAPMFKAKIGDDPRTIKILEGFLDRQQQHTIATLREGLPSMMEAMAHAYARRFTVAQLGEIGAFFRTPTGVAYMRESTTIVSDPDVAMWQRNQMTKSMSTMPGEMEALTREIAAAAKEKP